ncbi:MAG: hypothetical protein QY325_00990 [Flavobacteriales bacterium]|nr:MAG: hypothetical protein QY325_00990 [Flavobacteriales bacterium]
MATVNTFIPKNGTFEKIELEPMSFNDTVTRLGYHPDQVRSHLNMDVEGIYWVGFKIFTNQIVAVAASVEHLDQSIVSRFISNYQARYESYEVEGIFDDGVANGSLSAEYLTSVLGLPTVDPNGSIVAPSLGYELVFLDGKLAGYQPSDGLSKWAKSMKENNPKLFASYLLAGRKRWNNDEDRVRVELNAQADAFANIPQGLLNPLIDQYRQPDGTIDFVRLMNENYK